jgi:rubrerythrin
MKSLYFAKRAREAGAMDIAEIFEQAAANEAQRAIAHLDALYPKKCLPAIHAEALNFSVPNRKSKQYASDFKGFLESSAHRPTLSNKPLIRPYRTTCRKCEDTAMC